MSCRIHSALLICLIASQAGTATAQERNPPAEAGALGAAAAIEQALIRAIENAEESVVSIARFTERPQEQLGGDPFQRFRNRIEQRVSNNPTDPEFVPNEFGSGIIVSPPDADNERFILTNYHVVRKRAAETENPLQRRGEDRLYVRLANRRGYYASIVAADPRSDLAILNIRYDALQLAPADLKPIPLGNATGIRKGSLVLALGNPYAVARDGSASASWGIVSNIARRPAPIGPTRDAKTMKKETMHHYGTLLQVDTRLNLGTSGGALLNLKGELIGITTSLAALEGYEKSVGYAVPIDDTTTRIINTLARGREVEYGFLGVHLDDSRPYDLRSAFPGDMERTGARIMDVITDSPADHGGLISGDVVMAVDGEPTRDRYDLMLKVGSRPPGTTVRLSVYQPGSSSGRLRRVGVTLAKWPVKDDEGIIVTSPRHRPWRGLSVDYPTGRSEFIEYPFRRFPQAVVITRVAPQTPADVAKLHPGEYISHVNGTAVKTPAEFHQTVKRLGNRPVTLRLLGRTESVRLSAAD